MGRGSSKIGGVSGGGGSPTQDERDALEAYVSGEMMWVNDYLRNGSGEYGELSDMEKAFIKDLDNMTNRDNVGGQTLYRAVDASAIFGDMSNMEYDNLVAHVVYGDNQRLVKESAQKTLNRAKNKQFTEKGYMSTTQDRDVAESWGDFTGSDKPVVMEIRTGNSVKGAVVNKHASKAMREAERSDPQREVLLGRNKRVNVRDIKGVNGQVVVVVSVN